MSYVRFVPGFSRHPKRLKSGPVSSWLWACSVDYCLEHLTDGYLLEEAISTLCPNIVGSALTRAVDNLIKVGSWERVAGGFFVHDYLRHNASKKQVEDDREAGRQRYQKWVDKRRCNAVANALDPTISNGVANATHVRSVVRSDNTSTTPKGDSRPEVEPEPLGEVIQRIAGKFPELTS